MTDLTCPACESAVEATWHFCPVCSESLLRLCPSCGTFVSITARFCKACGWTLDVDAAAAEPQLARRRLVAPSSGFQGEIAPRSCVRW
jgi:predicted amidophosphoribosyltransferase